MGELAADHLWDGSTDEFGTAAGLEERVLDRLKAPQVIVKLLKRSGNILTVQGLDAIDGTPVIDIKSYMIPKIARNEIRMPEWVAKLRQPPKP